MIRLSVSEQQLFDIIMAVYAMSNGEEGQHDPETARRREALLDKLHRAFDSKIIAPRSAQAGAPLRVPLHQGQNGAVRTRAM